MDQHLNFIVDKTEKISALLTESMNVENASSRRTTPNVSDAEMDENDDLPGFAHDPVGKVLQTVDGKWKLGKF